MSLENVKETTVPAQKPKTTILIIEDESIVALDVRSTLERNGYRVAGIASSGKDGIEKAVALQPQLILMDIQLKGDIDGIVAAEEIRKYRDIPIIFLTAFGDDETLSRVRESESYGYILKPFQPRELIIAIEMAIFKSEKERQVRETSEFLDAILNCMHDSVLVIDGDEKITFINEAAKKLLETGKRNRIGFPLSHVAEISSASWLETIFKREEPSETSSEFRVVRVHSGPEHHVECIRKTLRSRHGETLLIMKNLDAIIERERLRRLYRSIVDQSNDAVISVSQDKEIKSWNSGASKLYGTSAADAIGQRLAMIIGRQDLISILETKIEEVFSGKAPVTAETSRLAPDGTYLTILTMISPLVAEDGKIEAVSLVERDITSQKKYEHALEDSRNEALETSRLKTEFLSNISHELKTPLNSIIGLTELHPELGSAEEILEAFSLIRTSADALLLLINTILDFSRLETGKQSSEKVVFNLVEAIESILVKNAPTAYAKGLEIIFLRPPVSDISFFGDKSAFAKCVSCLVENAVKFTDSGTIGIYLNFEKPGNARVSVVDTGPGIENEEIDKLFKPFLQIDGSSTRKYGGVGLGLATAKKFAELMNGTIEFDPVTSVGSSFSLVFPLGRKDDSTNTVAKKTNMKLVIVSKNPLIVKKITALAIESGFEVETIEDKNPFRSSEGRGDLFIFDSLQAKKLSFVQGFGNNRLFLRAFTARVAILTVPDSTAHPDAFLESAVTIPFPWLESDIKHFLSFATASVIDILPLFSDTIYIREEGSIQTLFEMKNREIHDCIVQGSWEKAENLASILMNEGATPDSSHKMVFQLLLAIRKHDSTRCEGILGELTKLGLKET